MIQLKHIRPRPIFSKPQAPTSSMIWNQELSWQKGVRYWVKAPSGGGKSTLVHIIMGLRKDYEGSVMIDDMLLSSSDANQLGQLRRKKLSAIFQDLKLIPDWTGMENIEATRGLEQEVDASEIQRMIHALGAESFVEQTVQTLSYGQRQRIAIIRALSKPFDFLLMDEPFSHLDEENIKAACSLIQEEVHKRGAGMLLVSHESPYHFEFDTSYTL